MTTFWAQATPGTTYYRCTLPARHLPGKVVDLHLKAIQRDGDRFTFPDQLGDVAVWQFPGNRTRYLMMRAMQQEGIRCLIEVDDNYLMPAATATGTTWRTKHDRSSPDDPSTIEGHRWCLDIADGVIVATPALAEAYTRVGNTPVYVCPNFVDPADWPDVQERDDVFRIGYAGSASHHRDVKLIRKVVEWAERQPDVEFVWLGHRPTGSSGRLIPWTDDSESYRQSLVDARLNIGLCPLFENAWSRCKSDVKALEYAMAGAYPVMSLCEPYRPWLGKSGWFVPKNEPGEWLRAVREVKSSFRELSRFREMSSARTFAYRRANDVGPWRAACTSQ